jgi:Uncharacterised protein family UPF0547
VEENEAASSGTKTCPTCVEDVKAAAIVCRFCGHRFDAEPVALPPRPQGPPPDALTKRLRPDEELFVWSDGYLWAASGQLGITSDRILFVQVGGEVDDHKIAVDRKINLAGGRVDIELGGGLWRFQGLHPDIANEIAATVVPGFTETRFGGGELMQRELRRRHETIAARAVALAPSISTTLKGCKYLGGISSLGSPSGLARWSIQFNPRDIQIRVMGQLRLTISEPRTGGVAIEG